MSKDKKRILNLIIFEYKLIDDPVKKSIVLSKYNIENLVLFCDEYLFKKENTDIILKIINNIKKNRDKLAQYTISNLLKLKPYEIYRLMKFINSNTIKKELLKTLINNDRIDQYYMQNILIEINSDDIKLEFLKYLSTYYQVNIIKSINNIKLKEKYVVMPEYSNHRTELILSVPDEKFILKFFKTTKDNKLRSKIIKSTTDISLKNKLLKYYLKVNDIDLELYKKYLGFGAKNLNVDDINFNIDKNIKIGIELECCNKLINIYKVIDMIYGNYEIKYDSSVKSGFEITSPILNYTQKDISKLKSLCDSLEKCNFYTDGSCGGHIHIGADYLENPKELFILLYLYCNCEDILYLITNKKGTPIRNNVLTYARKMSDSEVTDLMNIDVSRYKKKMDQFCGLIKSEFKSRFFGLNLKNINNDLKNTIEFRLPNGEINFKELNNNIKLICKLVEKSKELAYINKQDFKYNLLKKLPETDNEQDKLYILLDILFDNQNDKNIYIDRYSSNSKLSNSNELRLIKK